MTLKTVRGDLLALAHAGAFDVIAHGCNCFCAMGRGIAKQIKLEFPAAFDADKATARGDVRKLGTCTSAGVFGRSGPLVIVNAYTQFKWSGPHQVADYQAIAACMAWIKANHSGKRIGLPKIGAGLAGGDWAVIRGHIGEGLKGEDVTVVEYQQG